MITPDELDKLKKSLPRGYLQKTVDRVPYKERTVSKFFSGEKYNEVIHQAALKIAEEHKSMREQLKSEHHRVVD